MMKRKDKLRLPQRPAPAPAKISKKLILRMLLTLVCIAIFMGIYFGLIAVSEATYTYIPVLQIYIFLAAACAVAICIINRGFGNGIYTDPQSFMPQDWDEEKKQKFISSLPRRKKAKLILSAVLLSLCISVFADIISLYFT